MQEVCYEQQFKRKLMQLQTREVNESYVEVLTDDIEIKIILTNFLSAYVEGYRFTPKFKCGAWDGKKNFYILTMNGMLVPKGLILHLKKAMLKNDIDIQYKNLSEYMNITHAEFYEFISKLDLPFPPYDYQVDACVTFINKGRITAQMATGAGKSLVIYMLAMFFKANDMKSLVIVPSVSLVNQIRSDFDEYNFKEPDLVHTMMAGIEKHFDCPISISTWQSLYNSPDLFSEIDVIMVDEAHNAKSEVFDTIILPAAVNCKYRLGVSGTISDLTFADRMSLIGSLGSNVKIINAQGLIERGLATPVQINCLFFNYSDDDKKLMKNLDYQKEIKMLEGHYRRNNMIAKMTNKIAKSGNTILLFNTINHGKWLMELILKDRFGIEDVVLLDKTTPNAIKALIKDGQFPMKVFTNTELDDKQRASILKTLAKEGLDKSILDRFDCLEKYDTYMIYGAIEGDERERIRKLLEEKEDAIIVGNYQTMSTGINIKRLHNIILAAPTKSSIRIRQSIGRGLRLYKGKEIIKIWDITDDFSTKTKSGKTTNENHSLKHFKNRMNVYLEDGFPVTEKEVKIS
jgi:superfamily II DNA or RNA helicase